MDKPRSRKFTVDVLPSYVTASNAFAPYSPTTARFTGRPAHSSKSTDYVMSPGDAMVEELRAKLAERVASAQSPKQSHVPPLVVPSPLASPKVAAPSSTTSVSKKIADMLMAPFGFGSSASEQQHSATASPRSGAQKVAAHHLADKVAKASLSDNHHHPASPSKLSPKPAALEPSSAGSRLSSPADSASSSPECSPPSSIYAKPPPAAPGGGPHRAPVQQQPPARHSPQQQQPGNTLYLSATLPPRMARTRWALSDFKLLDKLYTGYASTVFKAICRQSAEVVVLKVYNLNAVCELYQHQIFREVRVHSSLMHDNIVSLYAAFQEKEQVVMVEEYADGNDLFTLLHKHGGRFNERLLVQMVMDPFLRVIDYLHCRGIIHRDIKPENIMFTKAMALKLGDFGLAIDMREERAVTRAGTLDYMAPEVLRCPFKNKPDENKERVDLYYNDRVDSWAIGVLTYELLSGYPPFYDKTRQGTEGRINGTMPTFPPTFSEEAKDFIRRALQKDPTRRIAVHDMLNHPFVEMHRQRRSLRPAAGVAAAAPAMPPQAAASAARAAKHLEAAMPSSPRSPHAFASAAATPHHHHNPYSPSKLAPEADGSVSVHLTSSSSQLKLPGVVPAKSSAHLQ